MEQIIIFIVLALLGSIFKGKADKKEPSPGQPKPFTATGRIPDDPPTKLKDMSKELYRELQKEKQRVDVEPPSRQLQQSTVARPSSVVQQPPPVRSSERVGRKERSDVPRERRSERQSGRLSLHGGSKNLVEITMTTHDLLPKNEQDLLKGIVFSEIFGPPKSKR